MAIEHVVESLEGLDGDYDDELGYWISIIGDPLDGNSMSVSIKWDNDLGTIEHYEIKIARVV